MLLIVRKEEGVSVEPTFGVNVIFGKRDEVIYGISIKVSFSLLLSYCSLFMLVSSKDIDIPDYYFQPMLVACARQLIEHIRYIVTITSFMHHFLCFCYIYCINFLPFSYICSKSGSSKALVLSLGLRDHSQVSLHNILF